MTLKELLLNNEGKHLTYLQYLSTEEWAKKRDEIIQRDHSYCTNCNKPATDVDFNNITKKPEYFWIEEDGFEITEDYIKVPNFKIVNSDKHYHLEVHHTRYILNRLPWDYKNEDLITLCNHCHTEFHQNNKVPVYSEDESTELEHKPCPKCNGMGYISEYKNVQNGICFQCEGQKYNTVLIEKAV